MIEAETIVQAINLGFTIATAVFFYIMFFTNRYNSAKPQPRRIHLIWVGPVFLCVGLLGSLTTDHTIAEALQMKYFSNGSQGFCVAYASYIAGAFGYLRIFFLWLARHFK